MGLTETVVGGRLTTATWGLSGSPYRVTSSADLPAGEALVIEAGVAVELSPGASLEIRGTLEVRGTAQQPVTFDTATPGGRWGGIVMAGADATADVDYMELTMASRPGDHGAAFNVVDGASVTLKNCYFHDFPLSGNVVVESSGGSQLVMLDCLIQKSAEAIHSTRSFAHLERVTVRDVFGYSDAIDFDYDSTPPSVIRDCVLDYNDEDDGIDLGQASPLIENVIIRNVKAGKALSLEGVSSPILRNILIHDCMLGIVSKDSCTPVFSQCTVTRCQTGVSCYEKNRGRGGGKGSGESMIVWGNDEEVSLDGLSSFTMTYSIVEGGYDGEGNVDADPRFVDPGADDFRLSPGSPAIESGKDGVRMGAMPVAGPRLTTFIRGEANGDGFIDIGDPVTMLIHLFVGGAAVICEDACDADDSGTLDISDPVYLLRYLFLGQAPPPAPFPTPGLDPTDDDPYSCLE